MQLETWLYKDVLLADEIISFCDRSNGNEVDKLSMYRYPILHS